MIVVDSSVWIAHFRAADIAATRKLDALDLDVGLLVGDIVLLEVLRGARSSSHARRIKDALRRFDIVPMLGEKLAVKAAENYRLLRGLGITVHKMPDPIIEPMTSVVALVRPRPFTNSFSLETTLAIFASVAK